MEEIFITAVNMLSDKMFTGMREDGLIEVTCPRCAIVLCEVDRNIFSFDDRLLAPFAQDRAVRPSMANDLGPIIDDPIEPDRWVAFEAECHCNKNDLQQKRLSRQLEPELSHTLRCIAVLCLALFCRAMYCVDLQCLACRHGYCGCGAGDDNDDADDDYDDAGNFDDDGERRHGEVD